MKTLALRGSVITAHEGLKDATVLIEGRTIKSVGTGHAMADEVVEVPGFLAPGFVDLQVNGAFGVDVVSRPGSLGELSGGLLATGTTSYLPTVVTQPLDEYPALLPGIPLDPDAGAEPLGLHLEGPFISPNKRGTHREDAVAAPDPDALRGMLDAAPVRMVTLAPELAGAEGLMGVAAGRGVVVSLGHSGASFGEAYAALDAGARSVTHLFNAMSPLHHRDPGLPGALAHPGAVCGLVVDGRHVHPEVVRLASDRLGADRMYLVTDAMAAAGMGPGEHLLAGRRVRVDAGVPRLEDGTLAGSILRMDGALRNALDFTGCSLPEAVRMAATTPAALIGEGDRKGRLAPGFDTDVVALSLGLEPLAVWVGGRMRRRGHPGGERPVFLASE